MGKFEAGGKAFLRALVGATLIIFLFCGNRIEAKPAIYSAINTSVFFLPGEGPYLEVHYNVQASSLSFLRTNDGFFYGGIHLQIACYLNDSLVASSSNKLTSDSLIQAPSNSLILYDMQRLAIPEGNLQMTLKITDINDSLNTVQTSKQINSKFSKNKLGFSDILLMDTLHRALGRSRFNRNGLFVQPNISHTFSQDQKHLYFYLETYFLNQVIKNELAYFKFHIKGQGEEITDAKFSKQTPLPINVLAGQLEIHSLKAGYYELQLEVYSRQNELLGNAFARFLKEGAKNQNQTDFFCNGWSDERIDSLLDYMYPIMGKNDDEEFQNLIEFKNSKELQKRFYEFWVSVNVNDPKGAFNKYFKSVDIVLSRYSTPVQPGHLTDRGRIFLTYGEPNTIFNSIDDPNNYPYIVWNYYYAGGRSNVRFIFYNTTLLKNDYVLLHSNMQGELRNPNWEEAIRSRYPGNNTFGSDPEFDFSK